MDELNPNQEVEESLSQQGGSFPQVVDESGKLLDRSDVVQMVTQFAQLAQLARVRKALEKQSFMGRYDRREVTATDVPGFISLIAEWPWTPWVGAWITNNGPNLVGIGINTPSVLLALTVGETRTIDHKQADEKIEKIYYVCDPGNTAILKIEGQY